MDVLVKLGEHGKAADIYALPISDLRAYNNLILRRAAAAGNLNVMIALRVRGLRMRDARALGCEALRAAVANGDIEMISHLRHAWLAKLDDLRIYGGLYGGLTNGSIETAVYLYRWGVTPEDIRDTIKMRDLQELIFAGHSHVAEYLSRWIRRGSPYDSGRKLYVKP